MKKRRILAVDDDAGVLDFYQEVLGDEYDIITAEDGSQALTKIGDGLEVDVVLTDFNMPYIDGIDLIEVLRGDAKPNVINEYFGGSERTYRARISPFVGESARPIVMASASSGIHDVLECLDVPYVVKNDRFSKVAVPNATELRDLLYER